MLQFWDSFSRLYPCGECAKHMRVKLKNNPPNVENNKEYSKWLCAFHTDVTLSIKPKGNVMDCNDINGLFDKWKPNEFCGCDNEFIEGVDDINNNNNIDGNGNGEKVIRNDEKKLQRLILLVQYFMHIFNIFQNDIICKELYLKLITFIKSITITFFVCSSPLNKLVIFSSL